MATGTDLITTYPALFFGCAFSGLGFPLPEDVVLIWAGACIATGTFAWQPTLGVVLTGILLRDVLSWLLGRVLGERLLASRLGRRLFPAKGIARARGFVARHGTLAVALGRLAIGFRVPVFVAAGSTGVRLGHFLIVDALAMLLTVPLEVALGVRYGLPMRDFAVDVLGVTGILWATLVLVGVLLLVRRRRARAARSLHEP